MPLLRGNITTAAVLKQVFMPLGICEDFSKCIQTYFHIFPKISLPENYDIHSVLLVPLHNAPGEQTSERPKKVIIEILVWGLKHE